MVLLGVIQSVWSCSTNYSRKVIFFFFTFSIHLMYYTAHPFQMYNSGIFKLFSALCSSPAFGYWGVNQRIKDFSPCLNFSTTISSKINTFLKKKNLQIWICRSSFVLSFLTPERPRMPQRTFSTSFFKNKSYYKNKSLFSETSRCFSSSHCLLTLQFEI